ncbi:hypothetical protein [Streptomyces sp. SID486]|uniref:hypothetical protein n=1 Tax=Streptomyces sp. SID486 TaxID=2690264 RepID=UPI001F3FA0B4|nr:hypothetical protein [Streptomyces sp. SID486]
MDDTQKAQEEQTPRDPSIKNRPLPLRRVTTAVVGAVALVGLSVGVALAATSGDASGSRHGVTSSVPPDGDSTGVTGGDTTTIGGGGTAGVSDGGGTGDDTGGTVGASDGGTGTTGGDTTTIGGGGSVGASDGGGDGGTGGAEPSPTPTSSDELAELDRRITELDKKVDQLPTKKELADALRAFADQLDRSGAGATPAPDPS